MTTAVPLTPANIRGHMFEVFIRILLDKNGWQVQSKGETDKFIRSSPFWIELKGRGTWHQIDSPCIFEKPVPFIYTLRLISEVKFLKGEVQKDDMRKFVGVVKDISENYFIDDRHTAESQERYTDVGTFFSANGFQQEAVNLGFAHGIRTVSYKTNKNIAEIKAGIEQLVALGFPSRESLSGERKLAEFKEQLHDAMLMPPDNLHWFRGRTDVTPEILVLINGLQNALNGIRASFLGTTSAGVLLHFVGKDDFPEGLFAGTDTQPCRVRYDEPTENGIPMWLEFSNDDQQRRFYFDVPLGLEAVIRLDGDILGEKRRQFAYVAVYMRIGGLLRLLTLELDKAWIDDLIGRRQRHRERN